MFLPVSAHNKKHLTTMSVYQFDENEPSLDKAHEEGEYFLSKYYNVKNRKERGYGNFVPAPNGDIIASTRSLRKPALDHIIDKEISTSNSMKAEVEAGSYESVGGEVVTVIAERSESNAGTTKRKDMSKKPVYPSKAADMQTLPKGHGIASMSISSNAIGVILGKQHTNIKMMIQRFPGTNYHMDGNTITIWGQEQFVKSLMKDIDIRVNAFNGVDGPSVPDGKLPQGEIKRRVRIADDNVGHVLGKGKKNLLKMRNDHPKASINFNNKTGEMFVFGEEHEVNKICDAIVIAVQKAKKLRAKETHGKR